MDYNLRVSFVGNKKGSVELNAPEEFFTEGFMERLKSEGTIVTPKFSVKYLGKGDAKNMDQKVYPDSEIIEIYDIDTVTSSAFSFLGLAYSFIQEVAISSMNVQTSANDTQIEDLVIRAYVHESVPVIGAAKVDLTGKTSGYNFKAGFDYVSK